MGDSDRCCHASVKRLVLAYMCEATLQPGLRWGGSRIQEKA